jgi:hypothetical protein
MVKTRRSKEKTKKRRRVSARQASEEYNSGRGASYLRLPEGVALFKPEAKTTYRLDFMYYIVGKANPLANPGDEHYESKFFVHKNIGPDEDWFICLAKTFKKPCPICEYLRKRSSDPEMDPDEWKELRKNIGPKERRLYLVKDLDDGGKNSPVQVYNESIFTFGEVLFDKIDSADEDSGYDFFADPLNGLTVRVSYKQSKKGKWLEVSDLELHPRKHSYDEDIAEEMPCLDDMLVPVSYDKLKNIFLQIDDDEEEDEPEVEDKPRQRKKKSADKKKNLPTAETFGIEEEDLVIYEDDEYTVTKVSGDGTSLTLEDDNGDVVNAVSPKDVESLSQSSNDDLDKDDEDEDEKLKPKPRKKKSAKKKKVKEEEEDEEDEEGWEDFDDEDDDD